MKTIPETIPAPDLRERLRGNGADALSDTELIAVILGTGHSGASAEAVALRLLAAAGGLRALANLEPDELEGMPGIGPARAARLVASYELGRRIRRPRLEIGKQVLSPHDAVAHLHARTCELKHEEFHALMLDVRHRMIGHRRISSGSLASSVVHPREVFRAGVRLAAAAIVVAHNHPSGDPSPSAEDRAITERLHDAGKLIGIDLLDHLVIGHDEFYSFAEARVLPL